MSSSLRAEGDAIQWQPRQAALSGQVLVKVPPIRVRRFDERQFVLPRPRLDLFLALDGARHVVVPLVPDEKLTGIARRKARQQAFPMLPSALHQIGGDAGVERAVALVCHDVDGGQFHPMGSRHAETGLLRLRLAMTGLSCVSPACHTIDSGWFYSYLFIMNGGFNGYITRFT